MLNCCVKSCQLSASQTFAHERRILGLSHAEQCSHCTHPVTMRKNGDNLKITAVCSTCHGLRENKVCACRIVYADLGRSMLFADCEGRDPIAAVVSWSTAAHKCPELQTPSNRENEGLLMNWEGTGGEVSLCFCSTAGSLQYLLQTRSFQSECVSRRFLREPVRRPGTSCNGNHSPLPSQLPWCPGRCRSG